MDSLLEQMPGMMMGKELEEAMLSLPPYDPGIRQADAGTRLMALNGITEIYVPSQMSYEIYSKIYLAMLHSLKKKQTAGAVRCNAAFYSRQKKHIKFDGMNTITALSFH